MLFPLGLRYMLLSAFGFAAMAVCVKLVYSYGIPVLEIVVARSLVSLVLSYLDIRRKRLPVFGTHKGLLFARGAVGAIALMAVYYAITVLPLAEATMLQYLHPMFVAVLALVFLGERFHFGVVACVVLSFMGLVLVAEPSSLGAFLHAGSNAVSTEEFARLDLFGVFVAIFGAFGSAIAYVLVRKLSSLEDSSVIILYFPMIALPMSLIFLGSDFVWPPDFLTWVLLFFVGLFTQVGQIGLTKAMQTETAARATGFSYVQVLFAVFFGFLFFDEVPSSSALLGAILIMAGAMINLLFRSKAPAE
jgi:drug/metabolite transporter (DMT)-like permease